MHIPTWSRVAALTLSVGCGLLGPDRLITGMWGGRWVMLDATHVLEPRLRFPCSGWVLPGPLRLNDAGHFRASSAEALGLGWSGDDSVHVSGDVRGDQMTLYMMHFRGNESTPERQPYHLVRGAEPDMSAVCLD